MKTILVLAPNPKGTSALDLDREIREIREGLKRSPYWKGIIEVDQSRCFSAKKQVCQGSEINARNRFKSVFSLQNLLLFK
jgi:hypothetical protein